MTAGNQTSDPATPRIFLIGFNKCGTTSFHKLFLANGLSSVHWRANTLAMTIHRHRQQNHWPVLDGLDHWTAYTDMICLPGTPWNHSNSSDQPVIEACRYFRELHYSYPNSLFILNSRDPERWVESRLRHDDGRFAQAYLQAMRPEGIDDKSALRKRWLKDWDDHHSDVRGYFETTAADQFLFFRLGSTPSGELASFLGRYFSLPSPQLPHHHKTPV
jgi:hypothetical protein